LSVLIRPEYLYAVDWESDLASSLLEITLLQQSTHRAPTVLATFTR